MNAVRTLPLFALFAVLAGCGADLAASDRPPGEPSEEAAAASSAHRVAAKPVAAPADGQPPRFAVVELFTSQGCSSCPPADAVLEALAERAAEEAENGRILLPISWHVDYWNRLGWADPYSDARHTARQRAYAAELSDGRVYTPQAVVNGAAETVGSRKKNVAALIDKAFKEQANGKLSLALLPTSGDDLTVRATIADLSERASETAVVRAVLLSRAVSNDVPRGENGGRTLSHAMVVRDAAAVAADDSAVTLSLTPPKNADGLLVAAFVQDRESGRIHTAAAPIPVPD